MAISSTSKHHPNGILVFDFANWLMLQTHSFLKLLNCLEASKAFSCHLKEKNHAPNLQSIGWVKLLFAFGRKRKHRKPKIRFITALSPHSCKRNRNPYSYKKRMPSSSFSGSLTFEISAIFDLKFFFVKLATE